MRVSVWSRSTPGMSLRYEEYGEGQEVEGECAERSGTTLGIEGGGGQSKGPCRMT